MEYLLMFVFGIVFSFIVVPILQVLSDLLFTFSEVLKGKMSISITKSNVEASLIANQTQENNTHAIGFSTEDCVEYYEDEYEDCNSRFTSNKGKIGF